MFTIQGIIQLLIGLLSASIGAALVHKIEYPQIVELRAELVEIDLTSKLLFTQNEAKLEQAKEQAEVNLTNWDKANEAAINTTNTYHDLLVASRLRDPHSQVCRDRVSESSSTGASEADEVRSTYLSEELTKLLRDESARADKEVAEKNYLLKFVQSGCNI